MTLQRWTYEGQTNGVTVLKTNINANGDPALASGGTTVATGAAAVTYSNTHPGTGSMGIVISATTPDTVVMRTPDWTATDRAAFQVDLYITAYPSSAFAIAQWRTSSGNQATLNLDTVGKLYLVDNASASQLLATTALPLNTGVRVNARAVIGAANNNSTFAWSAKRISDGSAIDSKSATNLNLNNAAVSPAIIVNGQHGKPNSSGTISGIYQDNHAWDNGASAFIADPANPLALTATPTPTTGASPLAVSLALSSSGGTGGTVTYTVDWGDGSSTTTTTTSPVTHTYSSPGDYTGTVTGTN